MPTTDPFAALAAAGFTAEQRNSLLIAPTADANGRLAPPGALVALTDGTQSASAQLSPTRASFRGSAAPTLASAPPPEYEPVSLFIERNLCQLVRASAHPLYDAEWQYAFGETARRPDSRDGAPLLEWTRAVGRLLVSVRETSAAEFEAIFRRLERSARTFRMGPTSTNYVDNALSIVPR